MEVMEIGWNKEKRYQTNEVEEMGMDSHLYLVLHLPAVYSFGTPYIAAVKTSSTLQ